MVDQLGPEYVYYGAMIVIILDHMCTFIVNAFTNVYRGVKGPAVLFIQLTFIGCCSVLFFVWCCGCCGVLCYSVFKFFTF